MLNRWQMAVFVVSALGAVALPQNAHAAKLGRVMIDNAQVLDKPQAGAMVVGTLPKGTVVATGESPTGGYYRMKSKTGLLGYIAAQAVAFPKTNAPRAAGTSSGTRARGGGSSSASGDHRVTVRAIGGLSLFNAAQVTDTLAVQNLSTGIGVGAEIGYQVSGPFSAVLRVETTTRTVKTQAGAGINYSYDITASSLPIMIGGQYDFGQGQGEGFSVQAALFAGLGLGTKISATATADQNGNAISSGNVTTFSKSTVTILPKVNMNYQLSRSFSLLGELGYRILKATGAPNTVTGTGKELFYPNNSSASFSTVNINMSGVVLGVGLAYQF